jgi:hypothetical protein
MNIKIKNVIILGLVSLLIFSSVAFTGEAADMTVEESQSTCFDSSLVGRWRFNEWFGPIAFDSSGKGNHGVIHGATRVAGLKGKALDFDGVDDYVECADSSSLDIDSALTIMAWINIDYESNPCARIISKYDYELVYPPWMYEFYSYELALSTHGELIFISNSCYYYNWDNELPMDVWVHVAVTLSNYGTAKMYINGQLEDIFTDVPLPTPNDEPLTIGISSDLTASFDGTIDEVRLYNRALSQEEIQVIM